MSRYKTHFELNPDDIELIEASLSRRIGELARDVIVPEDGMSSNKVCETKQKNVVELSEIRNLLGRLHHQKIWYMPKEYVPCG